MSRIYAFVLSIAVTLTAATVAGAATLATFSISDGTYTIADGQVLTITGDFSGDATGLIADPFTPQPLVFGAALDLGGSSVFDGELGPIDASPAGLISAVMGFGGFLDGITGGAFGDALDYMLAGQDRPVTGPVFDFGVADLFFSFTGGLTGPATLDGSFTAIISTAASAETLNEVIALGLRELALLGTDPDAALAAGLLGTLPGGLGLPDNGRGSFEAEFTIAAVPLPAGLPLLGAGLLGLVLIRRRRPA